MIRLCVSDGVQLFQESSREAETHICMCNISPIILHTRDLGSCVRNNKNVIIMNHETITCLSPELADRTDCLYKCNN